MNPLYDKLVGGSLPRPVSGPLPGPMQKFQMVMNAMRNPAAFIKQKFPDIPDQYMNDPNLIMQYLQQTRGISEQDIRNVQAQMQGGTPWQGR